MFFYTCVFIFNFASFPKNVPTFFKNASAFGSKRPDVFEKQLGLFEKELILLSSVRNGSASISFSESLKFCGSEDEFCSKAL